MGNANTGSGPGQEVKPRSGLLRFSLGANAVLAIAAIALAVWGWGRHQQVKARDQQVEARDQQVEARDQQLIELDKKVAAANEEREEAYKISRDLQYSLIKAKGELKGFNETLRPPSASDDQETDTPP
jgi:uncharacterized protein HemX